MTPEESMVFAQSRAGRNAAQNFLSAALRTNALIGLRLARLDALRELAGRVTRPLNALPGSGISDRVGEAAAELADQEEALLQEYRELLRRQKAIDAAIRRVPEEHQRMVLEMRYLQSASFVHIALTMHYDERQIYRLHARGLCHVAAQMASGKIPEAAEFLPETKDAP